LMKCRRRNMSANRIREEIVEGAVVLVEENRELQEREVNRGWEMGYIGGTKTRRKRGKCKAVRVCRG
jgi:hypothetical protein